MNQATTNSSTYFPLRWESTGDKWWYASPIDWAAANNHYDIVLHLLHLDPNHLISLTSLRRLRRLESLWDSNSSANRSSIARRLLHHTRLLSSNNYSGWLLYTAACAADLQFIRELLEKEPLLVFGQGEYGLTDMLYAAARSGSLEAFWLVFDFAVSPRLENRGIGIGSVGPPIGFRWEVVNRAVHAAARGGNLGVLVELLGDDDDDRVLSYRDAIGSSVLHAAAGRGQFEVAKHLISRYTTIISATDNHGNTPLHIAALKGHFPVLQLLLNTSPHSISSTNNSGNTILHITISGALTPGFRTIDRQLSLTRHILTSNSPNWNIHHIINAKNNDGKTALHMAIIGGVHSELIELLMASHCIDLNIVDDHQMTPLDCLRHYPDIVSSDLLIRRMVLAGGVSNSGRKVIGSRLRKQGSLCGSPGTVFGVLDCEVFRKERVNRGVKVRHLSFPGEISLCRGGEEEEGVVDLGKKNKKKEGSVQSAAKRLKNVLQKWPLMKKDKEKEKKKKSECDESILREEEVAYAGLHKKSVSLDEIPAPLRERFSSTVGSSSNKRRLAARNDIASPTSKKKFAMEFSHGPRLSSASLSKASLSSRRSVEDEEAPRMMDKQGSVNKRLAVNQYLCFGGPSMSSKNPFGLHQRNPSNGGKQPIQVVACN